MKARAVLSLRYISAAGSLPPTGGPEIRTRPRIFHRIIVPRTRGRRSTWPSVERCSSSRVHVLRLVSAYTVTYIHEKDVDEADELLLSFCSGFERRYGREACTPNLHMHCHLKECILDVGPLFSFWCFSFERYNGVLERMNKTWNAPEVQLIHKFANLQSLAAATLPNNTSLELVKCFQQARETVLPNPVISGISVFQYEQNILCPPKVFVH